MEFKYAQRTYKSLPVRRIFRSKPATIYFAVAAFGLLIKSLLIIFPFFGLEYEDAFIFTDVGRSLSISKDLKSLSYQTESCTAGSLNECQFSMTYGGHFIPFPLFISYVNRLFGYTPFNVFWINAFLSLLVLYISFKIITLVTAGNNKAILIGGIILASTPFYCIFNTSGLSETFSSVFVLLTIYIYLRTTKNFEYTNILIFLSILFISCSFLIKRENLILLSLPFFDLLLRLPERNPKLLKKPLLIGLVAALIAFLLYKNFFNVFSIEQEEGTMIGQNTFSLNYAFKLFPIFLKSLLDINYFSVFGIFILISPTFILFTKNITIRLLIIISWVYLFVYSFHYRGYYFVKFDDISTFDTLRFYTTFFPVFVVAIITFLFTSTKINLIPNSWIIGMAVTLIVLNTLLYSKTRRNLNKVENYERIAPAKSVLSFMRSGDIILTDIPIVFHIYCRPDDYIVDYYSMNKAVEKEMVDLSKNKKVYLLRNRYDKDDRNRYPAYFKFMNSHNFRFIYEVDDKYEVLQLID